MEKILKTQKKNFSALSFLAVEQGPGAFASLRIIIATVNGLAFSKKIKLVGVDGLDAVAHETFTSVPFENGMLVSLLNAYNNEVYYAIYDLEEKKLNLSCPKGYKKIDLLLDDLEKSKKDKKILFTGNGFSLHKDLILEKFGDRIIKIDSVLQTASAKQIGKMAFEQWKRNENVSYELSPLYLKIQTYAVK
jgi:tRNA threonylcarbamoyl adenosine modification protein YeaZ